MSREGNCIIIQIADNFTESNIEKIRQPPAAGRSLIGTFHISQKVQKLISSLNNYLFVLSVSHTIHISQVCQVVINSIASVILGKTSLSSLKPKVKLANHLVW